MVLAIILAIAIPGISGIISSSTKGAMESDAKMVLKAVEYKLLEDSSFNPATVDETTVANLLKLNADNYQTLEIVENNDKIYVNIVGQGKWDGLNACGSIKNITVSTEACTLDFVPPVITLLGDNPTMVEVEGTYTEAGATATDNVDGDITDDIVITGTVDTNTVGVYTKTYTVADNVGNITIVTRTINVNRPWNVPVLAAGMTPVKWDESAWVNTTEDDSDWYSYKTTDKKWANAKTEDGSMWVWIPRYAYKIATNYHQSTYGTIDIKFLVDDTNAATDGTTIGLTPTYSGSSQTNYIKHPAFTFGETELTGLWVAKFEMSGSTSALNKKPASTSLRNITLGSMFTASRNMETTSRYGWDLSSGLNADGTFTTDTNNVDTHMMKNTEWGVVAYLSQSVYGKNAQLYNYSSNSSYYTGGGSGTTYVTGVNQSTTGTIYGIYDIAGCANEYVMGNYTNSAGSSGLTPGSINDKYIDRYSSAYSNSMFGDAVYETSSTTGGHNSWYGEYAYILSYNSPWFRRGGDYEYGSNAGKHSFEYSTGIAQIDIGFRVVVVVGAGL